MPLELFESASALASDFTTLLVNSMSCAAWDYTWWADLWPHNFAKLLVEPCQAFLEELRKDWELVAWMEKTLFARQPSSSVECEQLLRQSASRFPQMSKFYLYLDGVSHQLTREILAYLHTSDFTITDPLRQTLSDIFLVPQSTKSYNEDVFRDVRASFLNCPVSKVTPWSRQRAAFQSLAGRDQEKLLPYIAGPSPQTLSAFSRLRNKKLLTAAIFSPPSNARKAKQAQEMGRVFDVGLAVNGIKPLIGLERLQNEKAVPSSDVLSDPASLDTHAIFLLPTSKEASYVSASAFASLKWFQAFRGDPTSLENALGKCWQGALLQRGQLFSLAGTGPCISLGFHGYAALVLKVCSFKLPSGQEAFSLYETEVAHSTRVNYLFLI